MLWHVFGIYEFRKKPKGGEEMRKTGIFILALTMLAGAAIAYGPGFGGGRGMSGGGFAVTAPVTTLRLRL
jgi:hypothetical protein